MMPLAAQRLDGALEGVIAEPTIARPALKNPSEFFREMHKTLHGAYDGNRSKVNFQ